MWLNCSYYESSKYVDTIGIEKNDHLLFTTQYHFIGGRGNLARPSSWGSTDLDMYGGQQSSWLCHGRPMWGDCVAVWLCDCVTGSLCNSVTVWLYDFVTVKLHTYDCMTVQQYDCKTICFYKCWIYDWVMCDRVTEWLFSHMIVWLTL